jgi:ubiquinone/menaquinone biosynthesis C-methylase UbiE
MKKPSRGNSEVGRTYHKGASRYDSAVRLFDLFRPFGFDIPGWRQEAIRALKLEPGDVVIDVGCGTGLNFAFLQAIIGPEGRLLGIDLSEAMLDQAQRRVAENGWRNVELLAGDAAQFSFPPGVDGVLSTFALTLVPECGRVVRNACQALGPGGRLVVLDMAWPAAWPRWFRHLLFFLRSYGVTDEVLRRRPWQTVWGTMEESLVDTTRKGFFMGGFYLAAGTRATNQAPPSELGLS